MTRAAQQKALLSQQNKGNTDLGDGAAEGAQHLIALCRPPLRQLDDVAASFRGGTDAYVIRLYNRLLNRIRKSLIGYIYIYVCVCVYESRLGWSA